MPINRDIKGRFIKGYQMPQKIRDKISETLKRKKTKKVRYCACGCGIPLTYTYDYYRSNFLKGHNRLNWKIKIPSQEYLYDAYHIRELSQHQIAEEIGCDTVTVHSLMKKHGIKARTLSECRSGKRNYMFGTHDIPLQCLTSEAIAKRVRTSKERFKNGEIHIWCEGKHLSEKTKDKIGRKAKRRWKTKRYQGLMKEKLGKRPNIFEAEFQRYFPQLEYVGNLSFFVGNLNPDFIVPNTHRCIDLFGIYWHKKDEEIRRIEYFSRHGYELLVVWGDEWRNNRDSTIQRVNQFLEEALIYA